MHSNRAKAVMTLDELPELISIEQAAQYLNVCRATMYNWAKKGNVPSIKIGNTRRIRKGDLEQALNNCQIAR